MFSALTAYLSYINKEDLERIENAYKIAEVAHAGQERLTGEPYILHPVEVAKIIAQLHLDADTICAALLHDVIEDTELTAEDIEERFGLQIADMVVGLTKLRKVDFKHMAEHQAENYRRFFLAIAKDPRVVVLKLADRLHNMRTLEVMSPAKQQEIAHETLYIYAPLAGRCGIQLLKGELEDLSLKYLHPDIYEYLYNEIELKRNILQAQLEGYVASFEEKLAEAQIEGKVYGRIKHFFSIYRKMSGRKLPLSEIYDLLALRVITKDITACYTALGIAHNLGAIIPSRFKDFISMPKPNGYQSLHTTIVLNGHENLEVQIRTEDMHEMAEKGLATHWAYKEGRKPKANTLQVISWMRELIEELNGEQDPVGFVERVKDNAFEEEIRVFTPNYDIITLPRESTPIDFAYRVHTEVGHRCVGAKVNNRIATLNSPLENGDIVEIITSKQAKGPSLDWLNFVKSSTARERIRSWLKQASRNENILEGESSLYKELRKAGFETTQVMRIVDLEPLVKRYNKSAWSDVLAGIGFGEINVGVVCHHLVEAYKKSLPKTEISDEELLDEIKVQKAREPKGIVIDSIDGLVYRIARCCNPLPGEEIAGYVTRGRGVTIHRKGCPTLIHSEKERLLEASWGANILQHFSAPLQLTAFNSPRLLQKILLQLQDMHVALLSVNARGGTSDHATIDMMVEVASMDQLKLLQERLRKMNDIYTVDLPGDRRIKSLV